jgi:hypothetical protein
VGWRLESRFSIYPPDYWERLKVFEQGSDKARLLSRRWLGVEQSPKGEIKLEGVGVGALLPIPSECPVLGLSVHWDSGCDFP